MQLKCALVESLSGFNNAVYLYNFQYEGKYRRYLINPSQLNFHIGPSISDENIYLFPYPEEVSKLVGTDVEISMHIVDMWTEFMKYGTPTALHRWPKATNQYGPYIKFGRHREVDNDFTDGLACPNYYSIAMEANETTARPPLFAYHQTARPYFFRSRTRS